jgi:hypothetical protein
LAVNVLLSRGTFDYLFFGSSLCGKNFLHGHTSEFGFTFSFFTLDTFMMTEVFNVLRVVVRVIGLRFGC